jgi:hypothetical protein
MFTLGGDSRASAARAGVMPASRYGTIICRGRTATQPGSGKAKGSLEKIYKKKHLPLPMLIPRGALQERSYNGPRRARKGVGGAPKK